MAGLLTGKRLLITGVITQGLDGVPCGAACAGGGR